MANLFAQNTANWDAANQWNTVANGSGSFVTPGSSDVCMANGKTVTVNISVTVNSVRSDTTGSATAGGGFVLSDGVTLTANVLGVGSTTAVVTYSGSTPNSATISGNVTGGATGNYVAASNTGTGTLNVNGDVYAGSQQGANGVNNSGSGTVTVTGTAYAGGSNGHAISNANSSIANANALVGGGYNNYGLYNPSGSIATVTGTITGGAGIFAGGLLNYGTATCTGTIRASTVAPGVYGPAATAILNFSGPLISTSTVEGSAAASGVNPCIATRWFPKDANIGTFYYLMRGENVVGGARPTRTLYILEGQTTGGQGIPATNNVRYGVQYGANNALTGTCYIPAASSVMTGVNVDATVGTAALSPSDFWNAAVSGLTAAGSIGALLKNAATVATVGADVAAN